MPFGLPASAAEIVALPTDEVAIRMLREFAAGRSRTNRDDLANPPSWGDMATVAAANPAMLVRVQEAWDWLVVHGLITRDPTQSHPGWGGHRRRPRGGARPARQGQDPRDPAAWRRSAPAARGARAPTVPPRRLRARRLRGHEGDRGPRA